MSVYFLNLLSFQEHFLEHPSATDLLRNLMDWFLYDNGLRHERVNYINLYIYTKISLIKIICIFNIFTVIDLPSFKRKKK